MADTGGIAGGAATGATAGMAFGPWGALLGGLGGAALGAFSGTGGKTVNSNVNHLMQLLAEFGYGRPATYAGAAGAFPGNPLLGPGMDSEMMNMLTVLRKNQPRDLAQLAGISSRLGSKFGVGQRDLLSYLNSTTGAAQEARSRPLAALSGAFEGVKSGLSRDLNRTIRGIFAQADAGAAARGIKSASTGMQAAGRAKSASESVFDMLANLGSQEAVAKAGIEERTSGNLAQMLNQLGQFKFQANQGLISENVNDSLKMMQLRNLKEQEPQQFLLDLARSMPVSQGTYVQTPSSGERFGAALQGLGAGYNQYVQQQNDQQMRQLVLRMLQQS